MAKRQAEQNKGEGAGILDRSSRNRAAGGEPKHNTEQREAEQRSGIGEHGNAVRRHEEKASSSSSRRARQGGEERLRKRANGRVTQVVGREERSAYKVSRMI